MCPSFMPPPPSPCGGGYAPAPVIPYAAPPPAFNDCCCQCGSPCRYRTMRARTHGARIFSAVAAEFDEDPTCNSEKLRTIIEENITKDPTISKRAIQSAAEEKFGGRINVICAKSDFSYVAYTEKYCQASSGEVTCYAFQPQ
uniref:Ground-like domain-containing protein n=1 Tax=Panagrellus redivivus TaxID=6233 RepID=A0A7E4VYF4_PANRE